MWLYRYAKAADTAKAKSLNQVNEAEAETKKVGATLALLVQERDEASKRGEIAECERDALRVQVAASKDMVMQQTAAAHANERERRNILGRAVKLQKGVKVTSIFLSWLNKQRINKETTIDKLRRQQIVDKSAINVKETALAMKQGRIETLKMRVDILETTTKSQEEAAGPDEEMMSKITDLEHQLRTKNEIASTTGLLITKLQDRVSTQETTIKQHLDTIRVQGKTILSESTKKSRLDTQTALVTELRNEAKKMDKTSKEQDGTIRSQNDSISSLRSELQTANQAAERNERTIKAKDASICNLKSQLQSTETTSQAWQTAHGKLVVDYHAQNETIETQAASLAKKDDHIAELERSNKSKDDQVKSDKFSYVAVQARDVTISRQQGEKEQLQQGKREAEAKLNEKAAELAQAYTTIENMRDNVLSTNKETKRCTQGTQTEILLLAQEALEDEGEGSDNDDDDASLQPYHSKRPSRRPTKARKKRRMCNFVQSAQGAVEGGLFKQVDAKVTLSFPYFWEHIQPSEASDHESPTPPGGTEEATEQQHSQDSAICYATESGLRERVFPPEQVIEADSAVQQYDEWSALFEDGAESDSTMVDGNGSPKRVHLPYIGSGAETLDAPIPQHHITSASEPDTENLENTEEDADGEESLVTGEDISPVTNHQDHGVQKSDDATTEQTGPTIEDDRPAFVPITPWIPTSIPSTWSSTPFAVVRSTAIPATRNDTAMVAAADFGRVQWEINRLAYDQTHGVRRDDISLATILSKVPNPHLFSMPEIETSEAADVSLGTDAQCLKPYQRLELSKTRGFTVLPSDKIRFKSKARRKARKALGKKDDKSTISKSSEASPSVNQSFPASPAPSTPLSTAPARTTTAAQPNLALHTPGTVSSSTWVPASTCSPTTPQPPPPPPPPPKPKHDLFKSKWAS